VPHWLPVVPKRGRKRWGVQKAWEHVEQRLAPSPTGVPVGLAPCAHLAGLEGLGPQPLLVWTQVVRRTRAGRTRLVLVHAQQELWAQPSQPDGSF